MRPLLPCLAALAAGCLALPFPVTPAQAADKPPAVQEERAALTVTLAKPTRENWPRTLLVSGGIFAWQEAVVASEIGGLTIVWLPVDVGSVVKRGQELARLSDEGVKATLAQQKANVAKAKAALALAKANGGRARAVEGSGAISEQQITQYLIGEESAEAELAAAKAALEHEEVRLRQTRILAADDGIISSRSATLGAVVQPGGELFRLVRQGRLEWRAEVTDGQLPLIQPGQKARIELAEGKSLEATARLVAPTLNPETRKGLVYFDLPDKGAFKSGMFSQGEIQLGESSALTLPQSAIVLYDGHAYVFELANGGDRVTRRKITTGRRVDNRVEITSGLEESARVVGSGGAFLKDGDRVRITEATP
ncbi:MAG: efflux RND transporter periplasmic adaptor subunit [Magnetococcales bacterium]|nr:efflux RND transporter periplasmic adaptor subunit [Magnetococcales bacterium]